MADALSGGLIPTYAGNTVWGLRRCEVSRAHPHVCGEHAKTVSWYSYALGSSPRMRGTREALTGDGGASGLIPTYAGNTRLEPSYG